jgi:hypothetical protein
MAEAGIGGDVIRALRAALKVLGRRFGLRAISVRAERVLNRVLFLLMGMSSFC